MEFRVALDTCFFLEYLVVLLLNVLDDCVDAVCAVDICAKAGRVDDGQREFEAIVFDFWVSVQDRRWQAPRPWSRLPGAPLARGLGAAEERGFRKAC